LFLKVCIYALLTYLPTAHAFLEYLGEMMDLCYSHRSGELEYKYLDTSGTSSRIILTCTMPLSEIVTDFFDKLKSRSSGFASFEFVTSV
jgi:translation factor GUF1, mitochondrial